MWPKANGQTIFSATTTLDAFPFQILDFYTRKTQDLYLVTREEAIFIPHDAIFLKYRQPSFAISNFNHVALKILTFFVNHIAIASLAQFISWFDQNCFDNYFVPLRMTFYSKR